MISKSGIELPIIENFHNFAARGNPIMTHGVIGNTSDFGSAESWFEPRWVNKRGCLKSAPSFFY